MAGMIDENFKQEVLVELSWLRSLLSDIAEKLDIETYESVLLKNSIQPEEEAAITKFIILNYNRLEKINIDECLSIISEYYFEATKRQWHVSSSVVERLIYLKKHDLTI